MKTHDDALLISEYWNKHKFDIANHRHWDCNSETCPYRNRGCESRCKCNEERYANRSTIREYDRSIRYLDPYLTSPISETSVFEVRDALNCVQMARRSKSSTMEGHLSCLCDIFEFAKLRGDASNILARFKTSKKMDPVTKRIHDILVSWRPEAKTISALEELREETAHKRRSLTIWQREKLLKIVRKDILSDGRSVGIAIIIYEGTRPAECRKLLWRDVIPFIDHPERNYFIIYEIRSEDGTIKEHTKSWNGTRKVPIHFELQKLLSERLEYVRSKRPIDYLGLPICCMGNELDQPCKDYQLADYADDLFDTIKITNSDLASYFIDASIENEKSRMSPDQDTIYGGEAISLYVLRKDFWTRLEAETQMTDIEKRFVMGHEIMINRVDLRPKMNDENLLWKICEKMDVFVLCLDQHKEALQRELHPNGKISVVNSGCITVDISPEILMRGGEIRIECFSEEINDAVLFEALGAITPIKNADFSVKSFPAASPERNGINCQYENILAHQNPAPPLKEKKQSGTHAGEEILGDSEETDREQRNT